MEGFVNPLVPWAVSTFTSQDRPGWVRLIQMLFLTGILPSFVFNFVNFLLFLAALGLVAPRLSWLW